jgi:hypothetical protein
MAAQRIRLCLLKMDRIIAGREIDENDGYDMSVEGMIQRIVENNYFDNPLEIAAFNLLRDPNYNFIMNNDIDKVSLNQQLVYHLIPSIGVDEQQSDELTKLLLGDNDEYKIEHDCIFTEKLYNHAYEKVVKEHMDAHREGYFEKEDLEGEQLKRHLEYVQYAKEHNL